MTVLTSSLLCPIDPLTVILMSTLHGEPASDQREPGYTDRREAPAASSARRWSVSVGLAVLVAGCAVLALAARSRTEDATAAASLAGPTTSFVAGPCERPGPRPSDPAKLAALNEIALKEIEQNIQNGWEKYNDTRLDGVFMCGWVRPFEVKSDDIPKFLESNGAVPVYDAPNGSVMGYSYAFLGYVDRATAERPDFDPARLRREKNGCDPLTDPQNCRPVS